MSQENEMQYIDWGSIDYQEAWDKQEAFFNENLKIKVEERNGDNVKPVQNKLIFCEHPHVYTLGKSGADSNMLISDDFLSKINATYYKTNRGGDVTYHGPGQIVGYPIIDLEQYNLQLKEYIYNVEEAIILTLKEYQIESTRLDGATGVWLDVGITGKTRKICAIGVRASRHITMHGFAFNVNTDLKYFGFINPCGFVDKGVTSLEKEIGEKLDIEEVKKKVIANFAIVFQTKIE